MIILALDLASRCGWACSDPFRSGVWDLRDKRDEHGLRLLKLERHLEEFFGTFPPDRLVVFESANVYGTRHINGVQVPFELQGALKLICGRRQMQYRGYSPSQIKKHATGRGNASKSEMVDAGRQKWPDQGIRDDNQADALWLLDLALADWSRAPSPTGAVPDPPGPPRIVPVPLFGR